MLLSAAICGFLWAQDLSTSYNIIAAALVTTLSVVLTLALEGVAVRASTKLALVSILLVNADRDCIAADDKARVLDLAVAMLTTENGTLRSSLLTDKV
jgi:hypothetical protein